MRDCSECGRPYSRVRLVNPGKPDERYVCQKCLPRGKRSSVSAGGEQPQEECAFADREHMHGRAIMTDGTHRPAVAFRLTDSEAQSLGLTEPFNSNPETNYDIQ